MIAYDDVKNAVKLGNSGIAENMSSTVASLGGGTASFRSVLQPDPLTLGGGRDQF